MKALESKELGHINEAALPYEQNAGEEGGGKEKERKGKLDVETCEELQRGFRKKVI